MVDFGRYLVNRDGTPVRPWKPLATYTMLGVMVAVWIVEIALAYWTDQHQLYRDVFVVNTDWLERPWSPVTSTFAHSITSPFHLLFNGMFLFFMGPTVERILGRVPFVSLFVLGGALSGILQVHLAHALDPASNAGAVGASGGLMVLMGILMVLTPHAQLLLFGIVPLKLWIAGILFAVLDVLGIFDPNSTTGHIAHLAGMALGLGAGAYYKNALRRRGLRLVMH